VSLQEQLRSYFWRIADECDEPEMLPKDSEDRRDEISHWAEIVCDELQIERGPGLRTEIGAAIDFVFENWAPGKKVKQTEPVEETLEDAVEDAPAKSNGRLHGNDWRSYRLSDGLLPQSLNLYMSPEGWRRHPGMPDHANPPRHDRGHRAQYPPARAALPTRAHGFLEGRTVLGSLERWEAGANSGQASHV
jgi:hypothetical protein